jgi:hypothetical protein
MEYRHARPMCARLTAFSPLVTFCGWRATSIIRGGRVARELMNNIRHSSVHLDTMRAARVVTRLLRFLGLCGCLALLISIASPADDAVQHELAPSRARHVLRASKANHPAAPLLRRTPPRATPVFGSPHLQNRRTCIPTEDVLFSGSVYSHPTGDRSPPRFLC